MLTLRGPRHSKFLWVIKFGLEILTQTCEGRVTAEFSSLGGLH
jgi:hypothetical protein